MVASQRVSTRRPVAEFLDFEMLELPEAPERMMIDTTGTQTKEAVAQKRADGDTEVETVL